MADRRPTVNFVVEKPSEGALLAVEVTNTPEPSREWAAEFLRNLYVCAQIPPVRYFLLAHPEHLYLWKNPSPAAGEPDFEGDTAAALESYLRRMPGRSLKKMYRSSLEMLFQAWLGDLVEGGIPDSEGLHWLKDSGLLEAVRDAEIRYAA